MSSNNIEFNPFLKSYNAGWHCIRRNACLFSRGKEPLFDIKKVYMIKHFKVAHAKSSYKVIDGPHMIYITPYTIIKACCNPPSTFPKYIYHLTPFNKINPYNSKAKDLHGMYVYRRKISMFFSFQRTIIQVIIKFLQDPESILA
jgi:hypothetical protein